jgi:hypothetical protein
MLDIQKIINNPNAQILLTSRTSRGKAWGVKGFVTQDINIGGSVNWGTLGGLEMLQNMGDWLNKAGSALNSFKEGADVPQFQLKALKTTQLNYAGTNQFEMSIPLVFVAYKQGDDVRLPVAALKQAIYPTIPKISNFETKMIAPLGYTAGSIGTKAGVIGAIALKIGQWFEIPIRLMLISNADFTFSKEVTSNGTPLYAQGQITLVASRAISSEEMNQFLSRNQGTSDFIQRTTETRNFTF